MVDSGWDSLTPGHPVATGNHAEESKIDCQTYDAEPGARGSQTCGHLDATGSQRIGNRVGPAGLWALRLLDILILLEVSEEQRTDEPGAGGMGNSSLDQPWLVHEHRGAFGRKLRQQLCRQNFLHAPQADS